MKSYKGAHIMKNIKEDVDIKKMYEQDSKLSKEELIKKYKINNNGITSAEANERLKNLGFNEIKQAKPKKW